MTLILVTGAARSGKSRRAEALVRGLAGLPVYIATCQAFDAEMAARIARHRADRGPGWDTHEEPLELCRTLEATDGAGPRLVDCLTLWLTNLILADRDPEAEGTALLATLAAQTAPVVLVTNEVGWSIVPDNALARRFRDEQGRLNQRIAAVAGRVELVVAGLPLTLKGDTP
ncbi:MAG: bifunctional adenosylcobinamide kinase/adenosylcobinamide-phosphate guanylyltransferase [Alkalilacustris sp.]